LNTVWITGVAGFTGRHLLDLLNELEDRPQIIGLGRSAGMDGLDDYFQVDLTQQQSTTVQEVARQYPPSIIIHLAAATPPCSDEYMWSVNVSAVVNLIRGVVSTGHSDFRFLNVGSAAEYNASEDGYLFESHADGGEMVYGRSKWAQGVLARQLGKQYGFEVILARTFNLIGPGLPDKWVTASLCRQFSQKEPGVIKVGNTKSERDFLDIRDVVRAYWLLANQGEDGEVYNVCSGKATSIGALIDHLDNKTGGIHSVEIDQERFRNVDLDRVYGNSDKLQKATGWQQQISVEQSIEDMLEETRA